MSTSPIKSKSYKQGDYRVQATLRGNQITLDFKIGRRCFRQAILTIQEWINSKAEAPGNPIYGQHQVVRRAMERESIIESDEVERLIDSAVTAVKEVVTRRTMPSAGS